MGLSWNQDQVLGKNIKIQNIEKKSEIILLHTLIIHIHTSPPCMCMLDLWKANYSEESGQQPS